MAWVATTSFETTDGSTAPTDGLNISATGDGTGWTATWTVTAGASKTWKYDNAVASPPNGTWVAECDCTAVNEEPVMSRTLTTAVTSGRISFRWRFNKTNRDTHSLELKSGATIAIHIDSFNKETGSRDFRYQNSAGVDTVITTAAFALDTWYKIDLDLDCGTDTFTAYINDVSQGTGLTFRNVVTNVDTVLFSNGASSTTGSTIGTIHYVDYIQPGIQSGNAMFMGSNF